MTRILRSGAVLALAVVMAGGGAGWTAKPRPRTRLAPWAEAEPISLAPPHVPCSAAGDSPASTAHAAPGKRRAICPGAAWGSTRRWPARLRPAPLVIDTAYNPDRPRSKASTFLRYFRQVPGRGTVEPDSAAIV